MSLSESYKRYRTLHSNLRLYPISSGDKKYLYLEVPRDERYDLFRSMMSEVRNSFISSNEHGLDGYLSVRLRHGTLSGQLRSPLEIEHILTLRTGDSSYLPNEYWAKRLPEMTEADRSSMQTALATFSKDTDSCIDMLKKEWLQISTEEKKTDGLFDFSLDESRVLTLSAGHGNAGSYEDFLDYIFQELWNITESCLARVRSKITDDLSGLYTSAFDGLMMSLGPLRQSYDLRELTSAISRARVNIQTELSRVASWFRIVKESNGSDFKISVAIEIAKQLIANVYPLSSLKPKLVCDGDMLLRGPALKPLVDVLFILLDNIVKHSGISDRPAAVKVEVSCLGEKVDLVVENELGQGILIDELELKIQAIKESMADSSGSYINREGGTGLRKIHKLLSVDLNCEAEMDFGVTPGPFFCMWISINVKEWIV